MAKLFSYSVGIRGLSRVRVYERRKGGPIHVEFTGGERQTLTNLADVPVVDQDLAVKVANRLSERLADGGQKTVARDVLGIAERRTFGELVERYHADMESGWSESHTRKQALLRTWWTTRLGMSTQLTEIKEGAVEGIVRRAAKERDWSKRTRQKYLRYAMALFRYAHRKLGWLSSEQSLRGIDVPKASRGGPSYSHAEMMALLEHAPAVALTISVALEVAYDTQARSRALLHLKPTDYRGGGLLEFRAAYDKAHNDRVAVLSKSAADRLEALLRQNPDATWIFEEDGERMKYERMLALLRRVEEAAGVPHVTGRGMHAVKRRGVTDARRALGDMGPVSKQSGTLASTLVRIYEQDDMEPKQAVADAMERLRRGA